MSAVRRRPGKAKIDLPSTVFHPSLQSSRYRLQVYNYHQLRLFRRFHFRWPVHRRHLRQFVDANCNVSKGCYWQHATAIVTSNGCSVAGRIFHPWYPSRKPVSQYEPASHAIVPPLYR